MTSVEVQDAVSGSPATGNLVELRNVTAGYGGATVLRDISISVPPSTVVAVLGPNGAGKTTLLKVATGLVRSRQGQIFLNGEDVTSQPAHMIARKGFCHIPEGRGIFPSLSVRDNIVLSSPKGKESEGIERTAVPCSRYSAPACVRSPEASAAASNSSLAMARAMISNPTVVAVDEASLGLSPVMVDKIYETLRQIVASGVSLILVEQYVSRAIEFADSVYLINRGTVAYSGPAQGLDGDELFARYLGEDAT